MYVRAACPRDPLSLENNIVVLSAPPFTDPVAAATRSVSGPTGAHINMVSTTLATHFLFAFSFATTATAIIQNKNSGKRTMSGIATEDSAAEAGDPKPPLPSEEPTEIELEEWTKRWKIYLRSKQLLA